MTRLDKLLTLWSAEDLNKIDPKHMGGTYGLSIQAVEEAIAKRKQDLADIELLRSRVESEGD